MDAASAHAGWFEGLRTGAPVIETPRLILRVPEKADFPRFAEMMADPATHFIGGPLTRGDAWRRFLMMPGAWLTQGFGMFSFVEKSTGLFMGQAGPWQPDGWPGTEVGYACHPEGRGQGYVTEACTAAIDWAFDVLDWQDVIHSVDPDNAASANVAKRLGSQLLRTGKFLPAPLDVKDINIWGQSRSEWRARRAPSTV